MLLLFFFAVNGLAQAQEFRGLWVDAFRPGFKSKAEVRRLIADARAARFNALFVEVRRRADAYYQSSYEPRAAGLEPGFDPLAELIAQAHSGGPRLEVHAWLVMYPVWSQVSPPPSEPRHIYRAHPDWLTRSHKGELWNGINYVLDPGHPEVQRHLLNVTMDLISRYDVDGVHLDYIRYESNAWGYNEVALKRFQTQYRRTGVPAPEDPAWSDFRRQQVTDLVRKVYLSAMSLKPRLKISAATIAWAPGIRSDSEWPGSVPYNRVLQDWRGWMEQGILDFNVPMVYFRQAANPAAWNDWTSFAKNHRYQRQVMIGTAFYLNPLRESIAQVRSTRVPSTLGFPADGFVGFSYALPGLRVNRREWIRAFTEKTAHDPNPAPLFPRAAEIPPLPWKAAPRLGALKGVVTDARGLAVEGARIEIPALRKTFWADATGFYGGVDLPPGEYFIKARAPGTTEGVQKVLITAGTVATRPFQLRGASEVLTPPPISIRRGKP